MATKKSAKKKSKKSTVKKAAVKKSPKNISGVGKLCKEMIMSGKYSRDQVIAKAKKAFPASAVKGTHISYYIWALKKDEQKVPQFKE